MTTIDVPTRDQFAELRTDILRRVAPVLHIAGLDDHEIGCLVAGEVGHLSVALFGPAAGATVAQALRVRVLDAVHADGRTFGPVDVLLRFA